MAVPNAESRRDGKHAFSANRPEIVRGTKTGTVRTKNSKKRNEIKAYRRDGFSLETVWCGGAFTHPPLSSRPVPFLGTGRRDDFSQTRP